jgi:hypothetical protein
MRIQPETAIYRVSELQYSDVPQREILLHVLPSGDDNRLKLCFNGEDKLFLTDIEGMNLYLALCHLYSLTKGEEK